MKKILRSLMLFAGFYLCSVTVKAQLSSDKAALTAQQLTDLIQKRKTDAKVTNVTTTPVSSDKAALTDQQARQIMERTKIEIKESVVSGTSAAKTSNAAEAAGVKIVLSSDTPAAPATPAELKATPPKEQIPVSEQKEKTKN